MGTVLMFLLRMLVKVYMKHRNGGKRTNSILVITIKNRVEDTLSKAAAKNDWMRRIDGIVITDEDMTFLHNRSKFFKFATIKYIAFNVTE